MADYKALSVGVIVGAVIAWVHSVDGSRNPRLLLSLGLIWALAGWLLTRNRSALKHSSPLPQVLFSLLLAFPLYSIHSELQLGGNRLALVQLAMGIAVAGVGLGAELNKPADAGSSNRNPAD
ncbi:MULTISPECIES: hypothetical protein [unclassified Haloferax]|uniref:hypothetical protein n=1 Tax=unclassified Haloferax TaxID=2625095 RepID=UPI002875509F|nr:MULTISPECIES: hypothetical protein [unclassified Haloferax]MDS0243002.1 hypothetical protein [Haloferax sp. S2CR25]MDS0446123.1 hypothetical protein [Haloferax sp. S2CR25-2]